MGITLATRGSENNDEYRDEHHGVRAAGECDSQRRRGQHLFDDAADSDQSEESRHSPEIEDPRPKLLDCRYYDGAVMRILPVQR